MTIPFVLDWCSIRLVEMEVLLKIVELYDHRYSCSLSAYYNPRKKDVAFRWARYTMDEHGYHVGYENWVVRAPVIDAGSIGWMNTPRLCFGDKLVVLSSDKVSVRLESAPRNSKSYYRPDADFGWQDFESQMDPIILDLKECERVFEKETRTWFARTPDLRINIDLGSLDTSVEKGAAVNV